MKKWTIRMMIQTSKFLKFAGHLADRNSRGEVVATLLDCLDQRKSQGNAKWRRCINSTAATVDKILPLGFVLLQGVLMATKAGSPPSQFTDL